jgi:hypothetical protein
LQRFFGHDGLLLLCIILAVTMIALPLLTYPLGRDQGEFATIGRGILDGRVPYRDLWNPKPPAIFYIYALAISVMGRTPVALRAIDFLIVPIICWALYWLGSRIENRRVGLWAALLFPIFYFTETFWTLTQNDGIVLLPMTLAMVCVFKAADSRPSNAESSLGTQHSALSTSLWAFLAGALGAYVVWFKYPFALFIGVEIIAYLLLVRSQSKKSSFLFIPHPSSPVPFLLGQLVVGGGGVLYLMSIGAWNDLLESARVTSQYTALTFNLQDFSSLLGTALGFRWQQWGLLALLAGGWFIIVWLRGKARGAGWNITLVWLLAGTAIMVIQAKAYDYHWLPMLPPLVLMGAGGLDRLTTGVITLWNRRGDPAGRPYKIICGAVVIVLLGLMTASIWPKTLPYLTGQEDQAAYFHHFQAGEFVADESIQVADYLRERVAPGDSLFIWGFRPEVYFLSQLNPGSRFIFQFPLVGSWYPPEWRKETVDTLWASMPPYALVLQVDYMPWVTGSEADSNTLLQGYTEMNNWLIANYERETQIGNFFIWRRKPSPT